MNAFRTDRLMKLALACAAPLALAACAGAEEEAATSGEPIAAIDAPDGTTWLETVTLSEDGQGYIVGNPDAPLKLAEYASHTCGACAAFAQTGKTPLKEYIQTGVVSFEQREIFLNVVDPVIAVITQCGAKEQYQTLSDEFWQNFNEVMPQITSQQEALSAAGSLPPEQRFIRIAEATGLIDFFAARGVSADRARSCLADTEKFETLVEASGAKANEVGVTGTPTFTLNGRKLDENAWPKIEAALQRAGAREAAE